MIRKTETVLPPADFSNPDGPVIDPADLGQTSRSGNYVLVSYLTSPLITESRNDYVVFVLNDSPADTYQWSVRNITDVTCVQNTPDHDGEEGEEVHAETTTVGVFTWRPEAPGDYTIRMKVVSAGGVDTRLVMRQTVRAMNPGEGLGDLFPQELQASAEGVFSFTFIKNLIKRAAFAGEWDSTRELLFELWGYVFDAANATGPQGIPPKLLSALLYEQLLTHPKEASLARPISSLAALRSSELEAAAEELNDPESFQLIREVDNAMGVAQIRPETAAMVLGLPTTPWLEKPRDPAARKAVDETIHANYQNLPEKLRIALFNVLRFPRSNIALAARLLAKLKNRPHRWPALTQQQLANVEALAADPPPPPTESQKAVTILATEYLIGAVETPANEAEPNKLGRKVLASMRAPYLAPFFRVHTSVAPASPFLAAAGTQPAYGGLTLSRGNVNAHVQTLRADLAAVGIRIGSERPPANPQEFDLTLQLAVREFQIYAKMDYIALELPGPGPRIDRLRSFPNLYRYGGPISGVANLETRQRLQAWKANQWSCPVVVRVWQMNAAGGRVAPDTENIWFHNIYTTEARRWMFVRDLSKYYGFPPGRDANQESVLGYYENALSGGPNVMPERQSWQPEAELLSEHLVGSALADLTAQQLSTFRVVRAVSEQECVGHFDCMNAYDGAVISIGPCHWTLSLFSPPERGELPAYFAYLASVERDAFNRVLGFFGVRCAATWRTVAGAATGADLWIEGQRKYTGWMQLQREDGRFEDAPRTMGDVNYFRNWHWYYRFSMAGRTIEQYRRRMWDMARIRIRDICATPWNADGLTAPDGLGGTRSATIADVFSSERSIALITRWHVWNPGSIVSGGNAAARIRDAVALSGAIAAAGTDTNAWTSDHEAALIHGIFTKLDNIIAAYLATANDPNATPEARQQAQNNADNWTGFRTTMQLVRQWPNWVPGWLENPGNPTNIHRYRLSSAVGTLSDERRSFHFDADGLPPTPYVP